MIEFGPFPKAPPWKPSFALALPTCAAWIPERAESFARLTQALGVDVTRNDPGPPDYARMFGDKESNRIWPHTMWRWAVGCGATHLVQLQDDVIPAPNFWPVLRAMVEAKPQVIIGLHSNHPLAAVQFRAGRRWYRDHWLTGPAYVFPTTSLSAFLAWCEAHPDVCSATNEDSLISRWAHESKVSIWHPVPTITDHDLGVPSTYGNDGHHEWSMYRQPPVTWRDAPTGYALEDPAFWRCTEESAPLLPGPGTQLCWYCAANEAKGISVSTGARICNICLFQLVGKFMGISVQLAPAGGAK